MSISSLYITRPSSTSQFSVLFLYFYTSMFVWVCLYISSLRLQENNFATILVYLVFSSFLFLFSQRLLFSLDGLFTQAADCLLQISMLISINTKKKKTACQSKGKIERGTANVMCSSSLLLLLLFSEDLRTENKLESSKQQFDN